MVTYKGDRPIISSNTAILITDIALIIASFIMFSKIANILSIISFLMVSSMSVFAYMAVKYMQSPEFERNLKNKVMGDLQDKMKNEIPKQLPKFTGPSIPM